MADLIQSGREGAFMTLGEAPARMLGPTARRSCCGISPPHNEPSPDRRGAFLFGRKLKGLHEEFLLSVFDNLVTDNLPIGESAEMRYR